MQFLHDQYNLSLKECSESSSGIQHPGARNQHRTMQLQSDQRTAEKKNESSVKIPQSRLREYAHK